MELRSRMSLGWIDTHTLSDIDLHRAPQTDACCLITNKPWTTWLPAHPNSCDSVLLFCEYAEQSRAAVDASQDLIANSRMLVIVIARPRSAQPL